MDFVAHCALVLAIVALGAAGLRVAWAAELRGLALLVAAATGATAAAVAESLVLGLAGLSGSAPVLLVAAVATWGAARVLLPRAVPEVHAELLAWWRGAGPVARSASGAGAALDLGWIGWQLRHPYLGVDGVTYHLPLAAAYAEGGRAAALTAVLDGLPVENYPVTNEVLVGWTLGLSSSWVAASAWSVTLVVLLVAAGRLGLRELRVPSRTSWLALAALVVLPAALTQLGGPLTDVPALAWAVAAAALAAVSRGDARVLAFALVAAALSFGTKTTPAVVLLVVLGLAAWGARAGLRAHARTLAAAAGLGVVVGGIWVLRNTALHGSPLWPLVASSFGDPVPPSLVPFQDSFLSHPLEMLDGRLRDYLEVTGGGVLLLAGGLVAPLLGRSRASGAAGALALLTALVWSTAPYTGITTDDGLAVGAVRYLLPCLAVCTVALALAARDGGPRARGTVDGLLALAVLFSLTRDLRFGFPLVPGTGTVVALLVLGGAAGLLAGRVPIPAPGRRVAGVLCAGLVAAGLTVGANGYLERHVRLGLGDGALLAAAQARGDFAEGRFPIAMGPGMNALLAGEELQHPLRLLGERTPCAEVLRRRATGWVVLQRAPATAAYRHLSGCLRGARPAYADAAYELHAG